MESTLSKDHGALGVPDDVIGDLLADCYMFLLRQRYERLAETSKDDEQVEASVNDLVMAIPTVPTPSKN